MSEDESHSYYDAVRAIGLVHDVKNVWRTVNGDLVYVDPPDGLTLEAQAEGLKRLRRKVRDEL